MNETRLRLALQKSGRLNEKSIQLLERCGLNFEWAKDKLFCKCLNFPLDVMLVRDDDSPEYVEDGVCDLGIVGLNVLEEKIRDGSVTTLKRLGFGRCRLSIAFPNELPFSDWPSLSGLRIATSYPETLGRFLRDKSIEAEVVKISGSVEVAPALKIADAICDLVSTGATLRSNGLREVATILESESVLIQTKKREENSETARLVQRIDGVLKAAQTKYIMMNAPRAALPKIQALLPGLENPSILTLGGDGDRIAIHAVSHENIFWETMEKLKGAGASSILVLPIEKIVQ